MRRPLRRAVAVAVTLAAAPALAACAAYPAAEFARAACDDLGSLMRLDPPSDPDLELHSARAAARADRAAELDGAFDQLYADLREVRHAVASDTPPDATAARGVDEALSGVDSACAELDAPIPQRPGAGSALTWGALTGS